MLTRSFIPLLVLMAVMFPIAPVLIARAPYESTMGLVQKIFYFHVSAWAGMFLSAFVCGLSSIRFLATRRRASDRSRLACSFSTSGWSVLFRPRSGSRADCRRLS